MKEKGIFLLQELIALGELIGNVDTGLPEESITRQLKTRTWASLLSINLEELPCEDQEASSCIICQVCSLNWPNFSFYFS